MHGAALVLAVEHGVFGALQQAFRRLVVFQAGDADGGGRVQAHGADFQRRADQAEQLGGEHLGFVLAQHGRENGEFVGAHPRHMAAMADAMAQAVTQLGDHAVATAQAERVIDLAEAIKVQPQRGQWLAVLLR